MAYKADIQLAVKGLRELRSLNIHLDRNGKAVDRSIEKIMQYNKVTRSHFVPTLNNLNQALAKAQANFDKANISTVQGIKAAENLAKAEKMVNAELSARNNLMSTVRGRPFGPQEADAGQKVATQKQQLSDQEKLNESLLKLENRSLDNIGKKVELRNKEVAQGKKLISEAGNRRKILANNNKLRTEEFRTAGKIQEREIRIGRILEKNAKFRNSFRGRTKRAIAGGSQENLDIRNQAISNALIGGAFPLLFGQGAGASAGGALGGAAGGLLGGQFGFALSLVGTQLGSLVDNLVSSTAALGRAIGPFARDTEAVTASLGLQGSVEEARLKLLEQVEGKTAAFNAAMKIMNQRIGERGVAALKQFGESARLLGTQFSLALTKLQAFAAGLANFILRITGLQKGLQEGEATRIVGAAATEGNSTAIGLVGRRNQISGMRGQGGAGSRKKVLLDQLKIEEQIFAIQQKVATEVAELTTKSSTLLLDKEKEVALNARVAEIMKTGVNKELAKSLAEVEQIFDAEEKILAEKQKQTKAAFEKAIIETNDKDLQRELQIKYDEITKQLHQHNIERERGLELTEDLGDGTDKVAEAFKRLNETIRNDIKEGIKGLIKGTSTLGDLLNNVADRFLDLALNQALFGSAAGEGSGGGIFGAIAGIFKANGGPVRSGKSFIVGEKGPELFTPGRSGAITPNNKLVGGGSTSVVVNVDASGTDVQGDDSQAKELGTLISVAVQGELIKQQRPGGLLASVR